MNEKTIVLVDWLSDWDLGQTGESTEKGQFYRIKNKITYKYNSKGSHVV